MSLFFVGINPRWQNFNWLPANLNVMYSAGGFWNNANKQWRYGRYNTRGLRWLDSGGFTILNKYGNYSFTLSQYQNLVVALRPHYYATLDYPCEPEISRRLGVMTNSERIKETVRNAREALDEHCMIGNGSRCVPVIQGYTLDEYKMCIELHAHAGTLIDYMAVGSMCRRISNSELHKLIPGIAECARQGQVARLHWFGLKLSPALNDLSEFIYSRDSAVALDSYSSTLRRERSGRRFPNGKFEKRVAFESFFYRLKKLGIVYTG